MGPNIESGGVGGAPEGDHAVAEPCCRQDDALVPVPTITTPSSLLLRTRCATRHRTQSHVQPKFYLLAKLRKDRRLALTPAVAGQHHYLCYHQPIRGNCRAAISSATHSLQKRRQITWRILDLSYASHVAPGTPKDIGESFLLLLSECTRWSLAPALTLRKQPIELLLNY